MEIRSISTFSVKCLCQQDAYVKQTIMRIMKIARKIYMEKVHGDLKKEVGIKLSIKALFFFLK